MSLYKAGTEVFYTVFDGTGSTKENWIERNNIIDSSATDITTATIENEPYFFTVQG